MGRLIVAIILNWSRARKMSDAYAAVTAEHRPLIDELLDAWAGPKKPAQDGEIAQRVAEAVLTPEQLQQFNRERSDGN